jgi:hypothetical protein
VPRQRRDSGVTGSARRLPPMRWRLRRRVGSSWSIHDHCHHAGSIGLAQSWAGSRLGLADSGREGGWHVEGAGALSTVALDAPWPAGRLAHCRRIGEAFQDRGPQGRSPAQAATVEVMAVACDVKRRPADSDLLLPLLARVFRATPIFRGRRLPCASTARFSSPPRRAGVLQSAQGITASCGCMRSRRYRTPCGSCIDIAHVGPLKHPRRSNDLRQAENRRQRRSAQPAGEHGGWFSWLIV